jgi:ribosome-associated protein
MTKPVRAVSRKKKSYAETVVQSIARGMQEKKARDIVILDLRSIPGAASDYFVICHGDSSTQVDAIARSVEEAVLEDLKENPAHIEGVKNAQWVLIDYISVVAHVFQPDPRQFYGLEKCWGDAVVTQVTDNQASV